MKRILELLYFDVFSLQQLRVANLRFSKKMKVFATYCKLWFLNVFISKRRGTYSIHNFTFSTPSFSALKFEYGEAFLRQLLFFSCPKKNPVIIDAGAHLGMTVLYLKWLYPNGRIWAYEPLPAAYVHLERNVKRNKLRGVTLLSDAVSNANKNIYFYTDNTSGPGASLIKAESHINKIKVKQIDIFKEFPEKEIDFLKLDVEGAEHEVLESMKKHRPIIHKMMIEYHHNIDVSSRRNKLSLARFLASLEDLGYAYEIIALSLPFQKIKRQSFHLYCEKIK